MHVSSKRDYDAPFHSRALFIWLLAALLPSVLTRNPFYLLCSLLLVAAVHRRLGKLSPTAGAWSGFARLAVIFLLFTLAVNVVLGGRGATVLVELPAWRWIGSDGRVLFQLGGAITAESLTEGVISALALLSVIYALAAFNALADHSQLLRDLPTFLYQGATVVSIALTFLPQLVVSQRQIRQAHALRGQHIRGLRDLLPLLVTLLAEGLDRAMSLAESMEARGFSGPPRAPRLRRLLRVGIAVGLGLLLAGSVLHGLRRSGGLALLVAGGSVLALTVWRLGRDIQRSRYRRRRWRAVDSALVALALLSGGSLLGLYLRQRGLFHYQAWPAVQWPGWDLRIVLALLPIAGPMVLYRQPNRSLAESAGA